MPKSPEKRRGAVPHMAVTAVPAPVAAKEATGPKGITATKGTKQTKNKGQGKDGATGRMAPENVTGTTRVNVAFPFSKIEVLEPSAELAELATLLSDLLGALAEWVPEETLAEMRSRADALCARLAT